MKSVWRDDDVSAARQRADQRPHVEKPMKEPSLEQTLAEDAHTRGDSIAEHYWRARHVFRTDGGSDPGFPPPHDRTTIVPAIEALLAERRHQPEPGEALPTRSDAYLAARYSSLLELGVRNRRQRMDAVQRNDGAMAIRLDAVPTDAEICSARARVFHSGVPAAEREAVVQQLAAREAWCRARDRYLSEATQYRLDSLDERAQAPTDSDRARARADLASRVPFDAERRSDAFAASAHESAIDARAREIARLRIAEEQRAAVRATLPQPPPMPRLPQQRADDKRLS